ncbi:MAG TPA: hypothetical protein VGR11_14360 [Solirubrobacteraceae bacterium]|nr:hypothetical protein [Solirubrobacteraceae bacterium]
MYDPVHLAAAIAGLATDLVLVTWDGDLARAAAHSASQLSRAERVRERGVMAVA